MRVNRVPRLRPALGVILTVTAAAHLGACSKKQEEPKVAEIPVTAGERVDAPEAELFDGAKQLYYSGLYTVAKDSFRTIKEQYPLGPYGEFAEIKLADCEFETNQFDAAAALYEEIVKTRPASRSIAYAILRAGRSHQLSNRGVGRDNSSLERALDHYNRLIRDYPSSIYAEPARRHRQEVLDRMAEYEKMVQEFYKEQNKPEAYEARKRAFEERWRPVLEGSVPSETLTRKPGDPIPTPAASRSDSPEEPRMTATTTVADSGAEGSVLSPATEPEPTLEIGSSDWTIQSAACKRDPRRVFVYLSRNIRDFSKGDESPAVFYSATKEITAEDDGTIRIKLPSTAAKPANQDCFGSRDLDITADGELVIRGADSAISFSLNNPPRLVVQVE